MEILGMERAKSHPESPDEERRVIFSSSPPSSVEATQDAWTRANHFRVA